MHIHVNEGSNTCLIQHEENSITTNIHDHVYHESHGRNPIGHIVDLAHWKTLADTCDYC